MRGVYYVMALTSVSLSVRQHLSLSGLFLLWINILKNIWYVALSRVLYSIKFEVRSGPLIFSGVTALELRILMVFRTFLAMD